MASGVTAEIPFDSVLAVLVREVAPSLAHLLKCGSFLALSTRHPMIVIAEAKKTPVYPMPRQWLAINQLTGPFQTPMDRHQFLFPCPGFLG